MKRNILMLIVAVAAISACTKAAPEDQSQVNPATGTYTYTVSANVIETKSDYASDGTFKWSAGDAISVLFHKESDNKFFTLTLVSGANQASASFSGEIETGYEIGASDGDATDKKIWALFPASDNHAYTPGSTATFNIPNETDFTAPGAHFSANIPMYALLSEDGAITFENIACAYKFTITDLDNTVTKVKLVVANKKTYGLSGSWPISGAGGDAYINTDWTGEGTPNRSIVLTASACDNKAIFYVSTRYWGSFQPEISIYNAENNYLLKTVSASKAIQPTDKSVVKPITISAPGKGTAPESINVDWSLVTPAYAGINDRIVEWKTTSDSDNIYFHYKFTKSKFKKNGSSKFYIGFDKDNDSSTGSTSSNGDATTGGIEAMAYFYPWTGGDSDGAPDGVVSGYDPASYVQAPVGTTASGVKVLVSGEIIDSYVYIEIAIPRAAVGIASGDIVTVITAVQNYPTSAEQIQY